MAIYCAMMLAFFGILAIYPKITEKIKPRNGRKPKLYFHFWSFHISILILAVIFLNDNTFVTPTPRLIALFVVVYVVLLLLMSLQLYFYNDELAIPFKCCKHRLCPCIVALISVCILFPLITMFLYVSPTSFTFTLFELLSGCLS